MERCGLDCTGLLMMMMLHTPERNQKNEEKTTHQKMWNVQQNGNSKSSKQVDRISRMYARIHKTKQTNHTNQVHEDK